MRFSSRWSGILLAAAALALPLKAGGCGRTACITVTSAQLKGGACPSVADAQSRFTDPNSCGGAVSSVDGPGDLSDGDLCCYPVTLADSNGGDELCGSGSGFGETTGVGGLGGLGSSGGFGGASNCGTCQEALHGAPFSQACSEAKSLLSSLKVCACNGACVTACDQTLCVSNEPDEGCLSCLQNSCDSQLTACQQD